MAILDVIGNVLGLLNKLLPSRKGALVDQINSMTAQYEAALRKGDDTKAAVLKKQLDQLRKKVVSTGGDV